MLRIRIAAEGLLGPSAARVRVVRLAAGPVLVAAGIFAVGLAHGGYAPPVWGWTAVPLLWLAVLMLALREQVAVTRAGLALAAIAVGFVAWTAASVWWSLSVSRTMFEVERDLVYLACIACVLLLPGATVRRTAIAAVAGLVALTAYALAAYLATAPAFDQTQGYLLFRPLGYANALGALVVLAAPPVLVGVSDERASVRAAAAAATVVLSVALLLTHNRSGWLALACALVVLLWRTPRDERALVVLAPALVATAIVAALAPDQAAARRLAALVVVACASVAAVLAVRAPRRRLPSTRIVAGGAFVASAGLVLSLTRLGDRAHYWRAAWRGLVAHPLAGGGAGTFEVEWFRYRDVASTVRDAHNLYLGTLAELGVVGLLLLIALLATPIVCARRTRDPLAVSLLASYCGFLVHVGFEWDWKFPLVTGCGLGVGAALVATHGRPVHLPAHTRAAGAAAAALAAVFAFATLVGNSRIASAEARVSAGEEGPAAVEAAGADRFLPWSAEPWLVLADATGERAPLLTAVTRDPNDWALWLRLAAAEHGRRRVLALRRAFELNPLLSVSEQVLPKLP